MGKLSGGVGHARDVMQLSPRALTWLGLRNFGLALAIASRVSSLNNKKLVHHGVATATIAPRAIGFGAYGALVQSVYHVMVERNERCAATWKTGEEGHD